MNKEDIVRMARETGLEQDGDHFFSPGHEEIDVHIADLERFAALVAAAEREACAKVCEVHGSMARHSVWMAEECAALIRARSNT